MVLFRSLMFVVGIVAIAFGLLFTLQGLGIVHWPSSSFMLEDRSWALRGVLVMVVGAILVWVNRPGGRGPIPAIAHAASDLSVTRPSAGAHPRRFPIVSRNAGRLKHATVDPGTRPG